MSVIVDSNVLVSIALKSTVLAPIQEAWLEERFILLGSQTLLREIEEVLRRKKFRALLSLEEVDVFLANLREAVTWMEPREPYPDFSDPKDMFLLAMARDYKAELFVTGDRALLKLGHFEETIILSPRDFIERLKGTDDGR